MATRTYNKVSNDPQRDEALFNKFGSGVRRCDLEREFNLNLPQQDLAMNRHRAVLSARSQEAMLFQRDQILQQQKISS